MADQEFKADGGKWNPLLLFGSLAAQLRVVGAVLMYGAEKYEPNSWSKVPNAEERYEQALARHIHDRNAGYKLDKETGLLHLAHIITNALFLMWFEMKRYPRKDFTTYNQPPQDHKKRPEPTRKDENVE